MVSVMALLFCLILKMWNDYSAEITPAGHPPSQAPQSIHVSASITYLSAPSEIAPTGQAPAQAPHIKHPSLITCAIILPPLEYISKSQICVQILLLF